MEYYITFVYNCEGRELYERNYLFTSVEKACDHLDKIVWRDEPDFEPLDREAVKMKIEADYYNIGIYYDSKHTWQTYAVKKLVLVE